MSDDDFGEDDIYDCGGRGQSLESRDFTAAIMRLLDPFTYLGYGYNNNAAWRDLQPDKPIRISVSTPNGAVNKFAELMAVDDDYHSYRELPDTGGIEWIDDSEFGDEDILESVKEVRVGLSKWWEGVRK